MATLSSRFRINLWQASKKWAAALAGDLVFLLLFFGLTYGRIVLLLTLLLVLCFGSFVWAALSTGVLRAALIELGVGIALFLVLTRFLLHKLSMLSIIIVLTISASCLAAAFAADHEYLQSVLLELGAGGILFIVLDIAMHKLLDEASAAAKIPDISEGLRSIAEEQQDMIARELGILPSDEDDDSEPP